MSLGRSIPGRMGAPGRELGVNRRPECRVPNLSECCASQSAMRPPEAIQSSTTLDRTLIGTAPVSSTRSSKSRRS